MEKTFPFVEVVGTEYETGVQIGKLFQAELCKGAKKASSRLQEAEIRKDFEAVRHRLESEYPDYLQHAYGRADGAGADRDSYLLFLCYEIWEDRGKEACSDIIVADHGRVIMGHNEDGPYSSENSALVKCVSGDGWYYDFSSPDALAGGSFGFTSAGLVFTMNYMYLEQLKRDRVPVWFFLRSLVECRNIEEIQERLSRMDIASGFHWNLCVGGKAYEIEAKYDRAEISEVNGIFVHTNHYLNPSLDEGYSDPESNTLFRYGKIKELIRKKGNFLRRAEEVESILKYQGSSYFNSIFETPEMGLGITACTVLYDSATSQLHYANHMLGQSHLFSVKEQ